MTTSETKINLNFIGKVLLGVFVGYLVGLGISYINVFGSSNNAPLICAMGGGIAAIGRLLRQNKKEGTD